MELTDWGALANIGIAFGTGLAAFFAWRNTKLVADQVTKTEQLQREASVDQAWMNYQVYYERCIDIFVKAAGMPFEVYIQLQPSEQRRMNLAALALVHAVDKANRACDVRRAGIKAHLRYYEGPLALNAIHFGSVADRRTLDAWNDIRRKHGHEPNSYQFIEAGEAADA